MAKQLKKKSRKKSLAKKVESRLPRLDWNFVHEAGPGCHIARHEPPISPWVLEWETVDVEDYDEVPDIAVDAEEQELILCNLRAESVVAYISVYDRVLRGREGHILAAGTTTSDEKETRSCTTLIVLCPPSTFCHLCHLEFPPGTSLDDLQLDSDVQVWNQHPNPADQHDSAIGFPLEGGPFLCTQGEGGQLTHFFSGNLHAIDFRCPIGTPLLAVGAGVVVEVKDKHCLSGVSVSNLFEWNSILIKLDDTKGGKGDPLFVEYVHIATASVKARDRVTCGQAIGTSGSVGFSPEPHLHFAAYRSSEPTAPTIGVRFQCHDRDETFLPEAGSHYGANGKADLFT